MTRELKKNDEIIKGEFDESLFNTETRIVMCTDLEYILDSVKEVLKRDLDPSAIDKLKRSKEYLIKMLY